MARRRRPAATAPDRAGLALPVELVTYRDPTWWAPATDADRDRAEQEVHVNTGIDMAEAVATARMWPAFARWQAARIEWCREHGVVDSDNRIDWARYAPLLDAAAERRAAADDGADDDAQHDDEHDDALVRLDDRRREDAHHGPVRPPRSAPPG